MTQREPVSRLQLVTFNDPHIALGFAVRVTMGHLAFSKLPFGEWADVLASQVSRGHQAFVIDETQQIRGFFGYALASRSDAEAWAYGNRRLTSEECRSGDCLIVNAWVSSDRETLRFMMRAVRRLGVSKQALYYKRSYPNGTMRASSIKNNEIVMRRAIREQEGGDSI